MIPDDFARATPDEVLSWLAGPPSMDPNMVVGDHEARPLHWAADAGRDDVCALLIECGAKPDMVDDHGATPLHWAAFAGEKETCRVLVEAGAKVNCRDAERLVPMHYAFRAGHDDVGEYLLDIHSRATVAKFHAASVEANLSGADLSVPNLNRGSFDDAGISEDVDDLPSPGM